MITWGYEFYLLVIVSSLVCYAHSWKILTALKAQGTRTLYWQN